MAAPGAAEPDGVAHRCETPMQDIFDDPAFPLCVAYRRLQSAVRIWAHLLLPHQGEGGDAADRFPEGVG